MYRKRRPNSRGQRDKSARLLIIRLPNKGKLRRAGRGDVLRSIRNRLCLTVQFLDGLYLRIERRSEAGEPLATSPFAAHIQCTEWQYQLSISLPPTMSIPILLMARELHHGGSERQLTEIARNLTQTGFAPHVGCFRTGGLRFEELRATKVPVVRFKIDSYFSLDAVTGLADFVRYVRVNGIRIVHAWDYPTAVSIVPATRLFTRAIAISSQRGHRELIPKLYRRLTRISDRFTHGIIVNCEFLRRHVIEDDQVPERKVRVCYNGVDLQRFRRLAGPKPPPLQNSSLVIGTVCSLRAEKDLGTLIDAFARVRFRRDGMMLVVVGSGPELGGLLEHAARAGIRDACHFEPATPEIDRWLSAMDVFVLPSRSEAFSNALMEAMACGCCVIASNVGGNPELVHSGENGLLFPPGDVGALADSVRQAIENPELRERLARQGESHVRENFSIEQAAVNIAKIYSDFLHQPIRG